MSKSKSQDDALHPSLQALSEEDGETESSQLIYASKSTSPFGNDFKIDGEADDEDKEEEEDKPDLSVWRLVAINAFALAYGLCISNFGIILLPKETELLWPDKQGIMLGALLGLAGLSQLVCPLVGVYSDRHTGYWGRRRPFILGGGVAGVLSLPVMWFARTVLARELYLLSFLVAMTALSVSFSGYCGIIPDFVNSKQFGAASGVMGVLQLLGSLLGSLAFAIFDMNVVYSYPILGFTMLICLFITVFSAKEAPRDYAKPVTIEDILDSYWVNPVQYPDFFWVFVVRTCYYMGISVQIFMLYYLRDVIQYGDPQRGVGILAVIGQCSAALLAYPSGKLSDRTGRKPLVYLACFVMASVYIGFALTSSYTCAAVLSAVYGVANGAFVSVDYALACDVLPSKSNAAKELGVWGISAFLGTMLGPLIVGPMLHFIGHMPGPEDKYSINGYMAVMLTGTVYVILGAFFLRNVKAK